MLQYINYILPNFQLRNVMSGSTIRYEMESKTLSVLVEHLRTVANAVVIQLGLKHAGPSLPPPKPIN